VTVPDEVERRGTEDGDWLADVLGRVPVPSPVVRAPERDTLSHSTIGERTTGSAFTEGE